jgi:hypothetical protein
VRPYSKMILFVAPAALALYLITKNQKSPYPLKRTARFLLHTLLRRLPGDGLLHRKYVRP